MSKSDERSMVFWSGVVLVLSGIVWLAVGQWPIAAGVVAGGAALLILARFSLD